MTTLSSDTPWPVHALQEASWKQVEELFARLPDPERLGVDQLFRHLVQAPQRVHALQQQYYKDYLALWSSVMGQSEERAANDGVIEEDPRFAAREWRTLPFFRLLRASYALNERWLHQLIAIADLPDTSRRRLQFAVNQLIEALAPTNFAASNPEAIRAAIGSNGGSLRAGVRNLLRDMASGEITRSEPGAFEAGINLAITPGAVIHENDIAQLIRYAPQTERVRSRPLLIVPPFINKYYILDLQPHNSFVRHAVAQGLQVFMISWRNPTDPRTKSTWDDYAARGVHEMIEVVRNVCKARRIHALGFCVGGTLLASALAVHPDPQPAATLTLLATLLDFSEVGDIASYIDEACVDRCESEYVLGGLVQGAQIANSFASLRPRDLVWSYVIDNYLKGSNPRAFDMLHWNSDSTNAPGPLFAWYLRNAYLENRFVRPGAAVVLGAPVDLSRLTLPAYVFASEQDHIVPWRSAYAGARRLAGTIEFVLGASGHVAGVINPPSASRRHYRVNSSRPADPRVWLNTASRIQGSWWTHWASWITRRSGPWKHSTPELGTGRYRVIEPAPGRYVRTPARARA